MCLRLAPGLDIRMHDGVREVPAYADCPTNPEVELRLMTCSIGGKFDEANAEVGIVFRDGTLAEHLCWQTLFESRLFSVCSPQILGGDRSTLPCETLKTLPPIRVYTEAWSWDIYFEFLALGPCLSRNCIIVDTLEVAPRGEGVALVNGPFANDDLPLSSR